jgi:protease I
MKEADNANKIIGAICYSPRILAKAGLLKGKKATGWNDDNELEGIFNNYGVTYMPSHVVVDGSVITADGPMAATEFAQVIINKLQQ